MDDQDNKPSGADAATVSVSLSHHGKQHVFQFEPEATVADLAARVEETLYIPTANQKYLVPRLGLLKAPFPDPDLRLELDVGRGRGARRVAYGCFCDLSLQRQT